MADKKYEEALQRASEMHERLGRGYREIIEAIFPQLRGSENERMSKYITNELACLRASEGKGSERYDELTKAITWTEGVVEKLAVSEDDVWTEQDQNTIDNICSYIRGEQHFSENAIDDAIKFLTTRFQRPSPAVRWKPNDQGRYEDIRDILNTLIRSNGHANFTVSAVEADLRWFKERYQNMIPLQLTNSDKLSLGWVVDKLEDMKGRYLPVEFNRDKTEKAISTIKKLL